MKCYGTWSKNKECCKECRLLEYCKDSSSLNQSSFTIEYNDNIIDLHFDTGVVTVRNPKHKWDKMSPEYLMRLVFIEMFKASQANPAMLFIIIARVSGLSLAEIGERLGMTKQAVHKYITRIKKNNPEFHKLIHFARHNITTLPEAPQMDIRKNDGRRTFNKKINKF